MKNLFKLIPVALGLLAFVSCSEDDFSQKSPVQQKAGAGDLIVNVEDLQEDGSAFTRSYLSRDMKTRMYTTLDKMKVYDKELTAKYDIYQFSWKSDSETGVFRRLNTKSNLGTSATPTYAVYPQLDNDHQYGEWTYTEGTENSKTVLYTTIDDQMDYSGTYLLNGKNDTPLYEDLLPRWGKIVATADGEALETNLSYMTGVLRLQLDGVPDYVDAIEVKVKDGSNYLNISGMFKSTLAINDVMQAAEFSADDFDATGTTLIGVADPTVIDVAIPAAKDLVGVDAMKAVVYVPLVTTKNSVDIEVYAQLAGNTTFETTPFLVLKDKTITRGKIYGNSKAKNFAIDGDDAKAVSDAIELAEATEGETLTLTATQAIDIALGNNIIYIPNKDCKEIVVNLAAGLTNTAADGAALQVKYKDVQGEGKYAGNVKLIYPATSTVNLDVDLDSTPFEIDDAVAATLDIDAKEAVFGTSDGTTARDYSSSTITLTDNVEVLTIPENVTYGVISKNTLKTINVGGVAGNITSTGATAVSVTGKGKVGTVNTKGDITVNLTKAGGGYGALTSDGGNITITNGPDNDFTTVSVAIAGKKGTVTITDNGNTAATFSGAIDGKDVIISGKATASGTVTASQDFSISGNGANAATVNVGRDATINVTATATAGEAITTSLKYTGNGKLNLTSGYIKAVDANSKTVELYHGENAAFTAIGTLTNYSKFSAKNASKWNGATAILTGYTLTASANEIWTASQLGYQLSTAADFTLQSDIDLDNKNWTGIAPTAAYTITGNGHKISNLNLVGDAGTTSAYAGFIGYPTANVNIDGFIFDGVKTTLKQNAEGSDIIGVGAVIGKTGAIANLTNVDVKLATGYFGSLNGTANEKINGIGGVIGFTGASSNVTLKGVAVDVNGATFAGWYGLGGLIGQALGSVTINKIAAVGDAPAKASSVTGLSEMEVTFLNTDAYDNDNKQGMTGYFIGSADLTKSITISDVANVNPTFTVGGKANLAKAFNVSGTYMYTYSAGAQSLIGQSGLTSGITTGPTINGASYLVDYSNGTTHPTNVLYTLNVNTYNP